MTARARQRRLKRVAFRIAEHDLKVLQLEAKAQGISVSERMRNLIRANTNGDHDLL